MHERMHTRTHLRQREGHCLVWSVAAKGGGEGEVPWQKSGQEQFENNFQEGLRIGLERKWGVLGGVGVRRR